MAAKEQPPEERKTRRPPATTIEARENQLIALAFDRAEEQLRKGTASSQVVLHYLKLGSTTHRLEKEKLQKENEVLAAKVEAMASGKRVEELYDGAIQAMRRYQGEEPDDD